MRAAIFNGPGKPITIEQVADPKPGPHELLMKIYRCGICGSDLSMTSNGPFNYAVGRQFGHEYAGEVVEVGREVTGFKVGDSIACIPCASCGKCEGCLAGNAMLCASATSLSEAFAEYIAIPPKAAVLLPRSLSFADGALIEPMACGLHALRLARMRGGERVLVMGAGTMALSIIFWARQLGAAKIVVLSRSPHRRDVVLTMGADAVYRFDSEDSGGLASDRGGPPDIVAECVGKQGMLSKAVEHVRPAGTVISMGMCMNSEPLLAARCTFKEVRMLFPLGYSVDEFVETAKVFAAGRVRPQLMVSDVIALEDMPATLEALRAGRKSLKVHVDPTSRPAHA